jgi:hypothetical protein
MININELWSHVMILGFGKEIFNRSHPDKFNWHFEITNRGNNLWSIDMLGHQMCYDKKDEDFIWQPLPSERTDEFLQRTRFPLDIAIEITEKLALEYEIEQEKQFKEWLEINKNEKWMIDWLDEYNKHL